MSTKKTADITRRCLRLMLCLAAGVGMMGPVSLSAAAEEDAGHADGAEHSSSATEGHSAEGNGHDSGEGGAADHGHAGPASTHPLSIDPDLAIVTLIVFVVLLVVLRKFAWGPIMDGLAKRETAIAADIDAAATGRQEAEKMLSDYQRQLERAGDEVRAMLDNAKKEAESMKQSIIEEANKAAAAEKERATREIEAAKNSAITEIAEHSVNIAFRVASDAVRREVKPEDHRNLVDDALKQFSNEN